MLGFKKITTSIRKKYGKKWLLIHALKKSIKKKVIAKQKIKNWKKEKPIFDKTELKIRKAFIDAKKWLRSDVLVFDKQAVKAIIQARLLLWIKGISHILESIWYFILNNKPIRRIVIYILFFYIIINLNQGSLLSNLLYFFLTYIFIYLIIYKPKN